MAAVLKEHVIQYFSMKLMESIMAAVLKEEKHKTYCKWSQ